MRVTHSADNACLDARCSRSVGPGPRSRHRLDYWISHFQKRHRPAIIEGKSWIERKMDARVLMEG